MKPITALAWKEWHDARPYLWIGLGLFLGLPLVGLAEQALTTSSHHAELFATPWVVALGGVLAVFVGVGVTTPDRRPKLEDFWRSRPIRVGPWLAVKYAVALAVVLACCGLPAVVQLAVNRHPDPAELAVLTFFPFFWTAIFSVAFLSGCLVARPSHAATLALAAMLLVYLLPVVLPPLSFMNVADFADADVRGPAGGPWHDWLHLWGGRQLAFAGGMLGLTVASVAVAVVTVGRGWRVESGRRTLYALVATALVLLFASAAFQLGTNLPVLAEVTLPDGERVQQIGATDGSAVQLLTVLPGPYNASKGEWSRGDTFTRRLSVGPAGLTLGSRVPFDTGDEPWRLGDGALSGSVQYVVATADVPGRDDVQQAELVWGVPGRGPRRSMPLWRVKLFDKGVAVYRHGDTLYLVGDPEVDGRTVKELMIIDVAHGTPRIVSQQRFDWSGNRQVDGTQDKLLIHLIPLRGVPAAERLADTCRYQGTLSPNGRLFCTNGDPSGTVTAYRRTDLRDDRATFDAIGQYRPSLLRRAFEGGSGWPPRAADNGLVYLGGWGGTGVVNSAVTVLDATGRRPLREVGHFAAPGVRYTLPLADGRAIAVGDDKLWLVAPPRRGE